MVELEPGYYWVRHSEGEDWEPALWNNGQWVFLGSALDENGDYEMPFSIGSRLAEPA